VVSNIGTVHAERAGSQENIFLGKSELVQALPAGDGVAVLNFDDPWVRKMEEKTKAKVFFYGLSPEATCGQIRSKGSAWMASVFDCIIKKRLCTLASP
jgi:UDP-N-acetylmuramyl pentapeptide synthase